MYAKKQDINSLCTLECKIINSMYTGIQDYVVYVHSNTRLYTLCALENKIIYSMNTRKQDYMLHVH